MKTITEFSGFQIAEAIQKQNVLKAAQKTPEEIQKEVAEVYKLENEKLTYFLSAMEVANGKSNHLKRVVIWTLNEGEKPPEGWIEKDGKYYVSEYFYVPEPKRQTRGKRFSKKPHTEQKQKRQFKNDLAKVQKKSGVVITLKAPHKEPKKTSIAVTLKDQTQIYVSTVPKVVPIEKKQITVGQTTEGKTQITFVKPQQTQAEVTTNTSYTQPEPTRDIISDLQDANPPATPTNEVT